jgi:hypothetical protein
MMMQTPMRQLALAGSLVLFACGNREIELWETARAIGEPTPIPVDARGLEPDAAPAPIPDIDGEPDPAAPGGEGTAPPAGPLPSSSERPPVPTGFDKGCGKIDFLFVIDNSDSMEDEQANLARSFPGFIGVMRQVLEATDFHIMVVAPGGDRDEEDEPAVGIEECEEIEGAGRRRSEDGVDCGIAGGAPFMVAQQPDLEATFSCLALVGTDGPAIERPMDAVLAATSAALNAPGRCNDGFLRDDAVLVVTFITDEEDQRSEGDPAEWRQALLDAKFGNEDALVTLGLVGDNNVEGGLLGGPCGGQDADGSPRLQEFVSSVDGVLGSVCAPDYTPFFQTAVGSIDSACSDFAVPVGP